MYKKLHTTGTNKPFTRLFSLLLALLMVLCALPVSAQASVQPEDLSDLEPGAWYYAETVGAIKAGLFYGTDKGTFDINANIDRAAFISVLYRQFKDQNSQDTPAIPAGVTDVKLSDWYGPAVAWAYANGITEGVSPTEFAPSMAITREQMCVLLGEAIEKVTGTDLPTENAPAFTDQAAISGWALKWVQKCSLLKLFSGNAQGEFMPQAQASRSQAACVFYRYYAGLDSLLNTCGLNLQFDPAQTEYTCTLTDFSDLRIIRYKGEGTMTVSVQLPDGSQPYKDTPYVYGRPLELNNGPATLVLTVTKADGSSTPYTVHLKAPEADDGQLQVSGFELNFDPAVDYYLCQTEDFTNCRILGYTGTGTLTVSVEQYVTYYPYKNTSYVLGQPLNLGHGRAKVTVTVTKPDGTAKDYLLAITDPNAAEYCYARVRNVNTFANVRTQPTTESASIAQLLNNARVYYLGTEGDWYKIQLLNQPNGGRVGYIHKDYLRWEWKETQMPAQYADAIAALQAAHPNWTFTFVDVESTYQQALDKELQQYGSTHEEFINPANYLNESYIYSFLDINTYNPNYWTDEGIAAIWNNTYALEKNPSIITKENAVAYIKAASDSLLMNPYFIASRAALESGYGGSPLALGLREGYEGYYNFYGIAANDGAEYNAAIKAKQANWNSQKRAIVEGANWFKDSYVDRGRSTPYFFRYARFTGDAYMTDHTAPRTEGSILKRAFTDPNAAAHFIIPVYRDLPQ